MNAMKNEKYWSSFARVYDDNQAYVVGRSLLEAITARLTTLRDLGSVVEFGCGTGYFTEAIQSHADRVVATDLSDELLKKAGQRFVDNPKIKLQKEDCRNTAFPRDSFDCVFAANVIHVIEKPHLMLHESRRLMKEGGRLIIVSFTNDGMRRFDIFKLGLRFLRKWGRPPRQVRGISLHELRAMVEASGFLVETAEIIGNKTKALFLVGTKVNR